MTLRSWHIIFLLILSFLMYPAWKGERRSRTRPTLFDALCIAAGLFSFGYLIINYTEITLRGGYFLPVDYFVASVGVIICFEMARRVVGSLAALAGVFFLYNFAGEWIPGAFGHTGFSWDRVVEHMFWGSQGLLGVGVGVSATYIFLFVLFGAFLYEYGSFTLPKTSASYLQLSTQAGLRPSANLVWRQKSQLSATFVSALMKRAL